MLKVYAIGVFLGLQCVSAFASNYQSVTDEFIARALLGDLSDAQQIFSDPKTLSESESGLSQQFQYRFIDRAEHAVPSTGDLLADEVLTIYRHYWIRVLMGDFTAQKGKDYLESALRKSLEGEVDMSDPGKPVTIYDRLVKALRARGFHTLEADAPPLRDLFLWRIEESRKFSVRLTDRSEQVDVVFMTDIFSLGWKEFATLGLVSTTGWVEEGRLYCVDWAYDRQSENFDVSYLKHETRHLADFQSFPGLTSDQLEYRAKLTELAFASKTMIRLLNDFTQKSAPNPESPHAYANFLVTRDLYQKIYNKPFPESADPWSGIRAQTVNRAARSLLEVHSEGLQAPSP
jgi:hypothetical protein